MPFIYAISVLLGLAIGWVLITGIAVSLLLLIIATVKKWALLRKVSAICLTLSVVTTSGFAYWVFADPNPRRVFGEAFHRPVPETVSNLQCHTLWVGDCWMTWLKFEVDDVEFRKLAVGDLVLKSDWDDVVKQASGLNAPAWWILSSDKAISVYGARRSPGKVYGGETILLAYDPAAHCAYYYLCGTE